MAAPAPEAASGIEVGQPDISVRLFQNGLHLELGGHEALSSRAEPGDSLVAEILDVRPIEVGFACLIPGFGQLIEQVQAPLTQVFRVDGDMLDVAATRRLAAHIRYGHRVLRASWSSEDKN